MIFALCSIFGVFYFDLTQNAVKATLYTSVATTILTAIVSIILSMVNRSVDPNYRDYSPMYMRILGSMFNLAWQGLILVIIVFIIAIAPLQMYGFIKVQDNVRQSVSYSYIKDGLSKISALQKIVTAFSVFQDPNQMQVLSATEEFQKFFSDKKVQDLLEDEAFMQQVNNKDFSKIIANRRVLEILDDNHLMNDFNQLAKKIYALGLPQEKQPQPKPE